MQNRSTRLADAHTVLYVRISPEDKRRLRALADRDFEGSVAAAIRALIDLHIVPIARPGNLDED